MAQVTVVGRMIVRIENDIPMETLYAEHFDGRVFSMPERRYSNNFPENGWTQINGIVPPEAEFIGMYVINLPFDCA